MEFRQLRYFLTLCEELHFSQAAEKLLISQPTLSQQIRVLEDEIGVPLFDRVGKKTVQTEAGHILEKYARDILNTVENAKEELLDLKEHHTGTIKISVLSSDLDYVLAPLLVSFHEQFPKTKVQIVPSNHILDQVIENEVDIGVGLSVEDDIRIERIPFFKEPYSLYVHKNHPLATEQYLQPEMLKDLPLVIYPRGFYGREMLEDWYSTHGLAIEAIMETGSVTSILKLVEAGIGAAVHPASLIQSFAKLQIKAIPIEGSPVRALEIYYRKDKYLSTAAKEFIRRLRIFFQKHYTKN